MFDKPTNPAVPIQNIRIGKNGEGRLTPGIGLRHISYFKRTIFLVKSFNFNAVYWQLFQILQNVSNFVAKQEAGQFYK